MTFAPRALMALLASTATLAWAADEPPPPPPGAAQGSLVANAPAAHWRSVDADRLLVMTLPQGRVLIELAPAFAPAHVANIQTLAREKYWDGLAIIRTQDNYVVQWGDPGEDIPGEKGKPLGGAKDHLPAEFTRPAAGLAFTALPDRDPWAAKVGFVDGFAVAEDGGRAWLAHCYGVVGAGRGNEADSSNGAQLYAIIGQSPRALDRNITTVGRVLMGMEILATMPRGTGPMGFYEKESERMPITTLHLASSLPEAERPRIEVLRTDSPTFKALNTMRRERKDGWTIRSPGRVDLCNVTVPVREAPRAKP